MIRINIAVPPKHKFQKIFKASEENGFFLKYISFKLNKISIELDRSDLTNEISSRNVIVRYQRQRWFLKHDRFAFVCPPTVNSIFQSKSIRYRMGMFSPQRLTGLIRTENPMSS